MAASRSAPAAPASRAFLAWSAEKTATARSAPTATAPATTTCFRREDTQVAACCAATWNLSGSFMSLRLITVDFDMAPLAGV